VTLVAGGVHCEITTISGTAAVTAEENLNPVLRGLPERPRNPTPGHDSHRSD
jgi:hypothetical protein